MLRSLHNPDSELLELCKSGSWESVSSRTRTHPREARVTDAARQGNGTTALSVALRSNASLSLIREILRADVSQIAVTHSIRGTILHEAFKHRVNDDILKFLIDEVIQYESDRRNTVKVGNTINMFEKKDELGRTPLHYMTSRISRAFDDGNATTSLVSIFRKMVHEFPKAVASMDNDGNTPLILLLVVPRFGNDPIGRQCEKEIFSMVQLMLDVCPEAMRVVRRLPRPWHFRTNHASTANTMQQKFLHGEGGPTPLSCAILHGRSLETVQMLISSGRKIGNNSCTTLVTHNEEAALHLAATMNSSTDIIKALVEEKPMVATVADAKGLVPLDWIWIRHVTDWCSYSSTNPAPFSASRRRYVSAHFWQWHGQVSKQYLGIDDSLESTSRNPGVRESIRRLRLDLIQRISTILPAMVTMRSQGHNNNHMDDSVPHLTAPENQYPLLHSACAVSCPLAMVALLCDEFPQQLSTREKEHGRLPLHVAASRSGYTKQIPTGVLGTLQGTIVKEVSPLHLILSKNPSASRIADAANQLPLHIAIDHIKKTRKAQERHKEMDDQKERFCTKEVEALLDQYPESLHRRDGPTKLYPFQQAAYGMEGDLELTFVLLRRDPTVIQFAVNA